MLITLVILLILLWLLGYLSLPIIPIPDIELFVINGQTITLWDLLILFVLLAVIGVLPGPFRHIAAALIFLWVLALLGFMAISGLANLLIIAIIVGLIAYLLSGSYRREVV